MKFLTVLSLCGGTVRRKGVLERLEFARCDALSRKACRLLLESQPEFMQAEDVLRVNLHVERDVGGYKRVGRGRDIHSTALFHPHQTCGGEHFERLAHRVAADLELFPELPFG